MSVVLFRVHEDTAHSRRALQKLRSDLSGWDVRVLAYRADPPSPDGIFADATIVKLQDLQVLPYRERLRTFDPTDSGSACDLPVLKFFRDHPDHDHYWIVEFDVAYSGNWRDIFDDLSKSRADLLGTTTLRKSDLPNWAHWPSLRYEARELPEAVCIKSFLPFARLSNRALKAIDAAYVDGLDGNFEATWPTACALNGLSIEDIGSHSAFTPDQRRGMHYTNAPHSAYLCPGTFVFRPAYSQIQVDNAGLQAMLWHPVKD